MAGKRKPGGSTLDPTVPVVIDESVGSVIDRDRWGKIIGENEQPPLAVALMAYDPEREPPTFRRDGSRA